MAQPACRKMVALGGVASMVVFLFRRPLFFIFDFHWFHWDAYLKPISQLGWFFISTPVVEVANASGQYYSGEQDISCVLGFLT